LSPKCQKFVNVDVTDEKSTLRKLRVLGTIQHHCSSNWASSLPLSFSPQVSSAEESSLEAEAPVLQPPEESYAPPVSQPVTGLPDAARVWALDEQLRVLAYSAVRRAGAQQAQRVWFQAGSVRAAVSPVLAVAQSGARYARAVQSALPVQHYGSVALPLAGPALALLLDGLVA
jgi:hypothetical protein